MSTLCIWIDIVLEGFTPISIVLFSTILLFHIIFVNSIEGRRKDNRLGGLMGWMDLFYSSRDISESVFDWVYIDVNVHPTV